MTTAFVLSGGASLGAVEVGMLAALVDRGVRPDLIVGTSVGAFNGAWLAAGATDTAVEALADVWRGLRRRDVFPAGLLTGLAGFRGVTDHLVSDRGVRHLLKQHLRFARLEDAVIPLHVVATDVLSGLDVCLSQGPAQDAVAASAAIPGLLPPVVVDGHTLMDGGAVNNTPISHAVALGASTIWVLSTGSACGMNAPPRSALGMALHGLTLAINHRIAGDIRRYESVAELRVVPPLCPVRISPADFSHAAELISRAEQQTRAWLDQDLPAGGQSYLLMPHRH